MKVTTHVSITLMVTREYNWADTTRMGDVKSIASDDAIAAIDRVLKSSGVQRLADIKVKLVVVAED